MRPDLLEIIAAAVCRFDIRIDEKGEMAAAISHDVCAETCGYCRLFAQHISNEIEKGSTYGQKQPS